MTKALVIKTSGEVEQITLPDEKAFLEIQKHVGGVFDFVSMGENNIGAYVNDEGLLVGLEPNPLLCLMFGRMLVGDAVLVGLGDGDGNDGDVPAHYLTDDFKAFGREMGKDETLRTNLVQWRDEMDITPKLIF